MASLPEAAVHELIETGRRFAARGWVPATSGNFSVRIAADTIAITASGADKGALAPEAILTVDLDGRAHDAGRRASNEVLLHTQLYRRDAAIGAVLHVHALHPTVLSRLASDTIRITGWELQKAFPGVAHDAVIELPVFPNLQDIAALAAEVETFMDRHGMPVGYMIAGHGLYTWGATLADARRHVEALEFLCECELEMRRQVR